QARLHPVARRVLDLRITHFGLNGIAQLDIANRIGCLFYESGYSGISAAIDAFHWPSHLGVRADLALPNGAHLGKVVCEHKFVRLGSLRCTWIISSPGSFTPGLSLAIAASFHFLIDPIMMPTIVSGVNFSSAVTFGML